jgi:membrane protein YdbS with pleckstrin-like domain
MGVIVKRSHIKKRVALVVVGAMLLALMFLVLEPFLGELLMPLATAVVIVFVAIDIVNYIKYSNTRVENAEAGVTFSSGIFRRTVVTYPYGKVTGIRTDVSIIDRLFGLKTLMIDTAGEAGIELIIHDVPAGGCDMFCKELHGRISTAKKEQD